MDTENATSAQDTEADLIVRARAGDTGAWGVLYERHSPGARRFARRIAGPCDAEDLVSVAFERTFGAISRGGGPLDSFRAYLMTAVRHAYVSHVRIDSRYAWTSNQERLDAALFAPDATELIAESTILAAAFRELPERWQAVLWQSAVEGASASELASRYGITRNSMSALTYRAREGLRQAYLAQHIASTQEVTCREIRTLIPAFHRGSLSSRVDEVGAHLAGCGSCAEVISELSLIMSPRPERLDDEAPRRSWGADRRSAPDRRVHMGA